MTSNVVESVNSVISEVSEKNFEVIIVDNNSLNSEKDLLNKKLSGYDNVKLYFLESNNGFGAGNNFGVDKSSCDILLLLNPDTLFNADILKDAEYLFNKNPEISVIGPKIINENNIQEKSAGKFPGLLSEFLNIFSLSPYFEKKYFNSQIKNSANGFVEVDWITGSAMFIRKSIFESIGGFDTNFFMYSEEIDLCKRIKVLGGRIIYYPALELIHKGSAGSKKNYYFFTKTSYESKYFYIKKHFNGFNKFLMICFLKIHIMIQLLVWTILYPVNQQKSTGKIKAFRKLLFSSKISDGSE